MNDWYDSLLERKLEWAEAEEAKRQAAAQSDVPPGMHQHMLLLSCVITITSCHLNLLRYRYDSINRRETIGNVERTESISSTNHQ